MYLAHYLGSLRQCQAELADAFRTVRRGHLREPDLYGVCERLAEQCGEGARRLGPFIRRYAACSPEWSEHARPRSLFGTSRSRLGLLGDLHDLYLLATECEISWTLVAQAAEGVRDEELLALARRCHAENAVHLLWLRTRMRQTAPQTLLVAS